MKINVAQLRRLGGGTEKYHFNEGLSPLQLGEDEFAFQSPVDVELGVINAGKSLLVKGRISCEIGAACSKCLKDFPYKMSFEFEDKFIPVEFAPEEEDDGAFIFERDECSIDERIQEHILLHLPMRFVCSDLCLGLCPKCGADLNFNPCGCADVDVDPRLEILSKWNKGV